MTRAGGDGCSIGELGLNEYVMYVILDGADADPEGSGDLLVGQAASHETGDLPLASGQHIEDRPIVRGHHDDERDGP
jgi:hypothetical protein